MRRVIGVLACVPLVVETGWLAYLAWAVFWRIRCEGEDCYWSGVVIWLWVKVGALLLPFAIAGVVVLFRLSRVRAVRA